MVGWHYRLNGHEFEQAPGDGKGQGSLVCCSAWGCKESDTTELLNTSGPDSAGFMELLFLPYLLYNFPPKNDIITYKIYGPYVALPFLKSLPPSQHINIVLIFAITIHMFLSLYSSTLYSIAL